jgi:hypothetical protein
VAHRNSLGEHIVTKPAIGLFGLAILVLAACGGNGASPSQQSCGSPPPTSQPWLYLVYPMPSATNIPVNVGVAIFANGGGVAAGGNVTITGAGLEVNALGVFAPEPTPLPEPYVTPGIDSYSASDPYVALPLPTLVPEATYNVTYIYQAWADAPPKCSAQQSTSLGTFTTQSIGVGTVVRRK